MTIYLKGYYGYKNIGDELLLFGVLQRLIKEYNPTKIYIESGDTKRLQQRLTTNSRVLKLIGATSDSLTILPVSKKTNCRTKRDLTVFGGGEVISDARPFPYNGWTYLALFFPTLISRKYIILGGVGTPHKRSTKILYKLFLKRAQKIVVRDNHSYRTTKQFSTQTILYKDFCYDFLQQYITKYTKKPKQLDHLIVNVNRYIRSEETKQTILSTAKNYKKVYYLPGELDSDDEYFSELQSHLPQLQLLDWTQTPLDEVMKIIGSAAYGVAARLHVLLLLDYFGVEYTPLIYQEKITHVLGVSKT